MSFLKRFALAQLRVPIVRWLKERAFVLSDANKKSLDIRYRLQVEKYGLPPGFLAEITQSVMTDVCDNAIANVDHVLDHV